MQDLGWVARIPARYSFKLFESIQFELCMLALILSDNVYLEFVVQEFDPKIIRNVAFFLEDM